MSEWIEWNGGQQPRNVRGQRVDLRFRSGQEAVDQNPDDWLWEHYQNWNGGIGHIVAYRPSPAQQDRREA